MANYEMIKKSRELASMIDEVLVFAKDYINSIENPNNTQEVKISVNNRIHAKLLELLFMRDDVAEDRKTAHSLKLMSKVIVDKQLEYHMLEGKIGLQEN